jgi:hypothetical protein
MSLRRWSLLAVAGLAVGCSGAHSAANAGPPGSVRASLSILTAQPKLPSGWGTWSSAGNVRIRYPSQWHLTPYLGVPATVVFPLVHLSSAALTGPCASSKKSVQDSADCFAKTWPVAADGVLVKWVATQFPTGRPLKFAPGKRVRIDGRPARLDVERASDRTWTVTATIGSAVTTDNQTTVMTAQIGPKATQTTIDDVFTMLATVDISD